MLQTSLDQRGHRSGVCCGPACIPQEGAPMPLPSSIIVASVGVVACGAGRKRSEIARCLAIGKRARGMQPAAAPSSP